MTEVRTRFAPSPTGHLHIGGARTALFNFLFSRHEGGKFILRIEDTDRQRSKQEFIDGILDSMKWLGLDWDEGPLYQSERYEVYEKCLERLKEKGHVYYCTCSPEELKKMREDAMAKGAPLKYNGKCRDRTEPPEAEHVVRFAHPLAGMVHVNDAVKGGVDFDNEQLDDFIIRRSDGTFTYNFVVVADDIDMGITHIIRGDDHLNNTPRQIHLYEALGETPPVFAHMPLTLGPDRAKLSKRHGASSVTAYREMGYLPQTLVNFLARLGWSCGDEELFSLSDLIEKFTIEGIGKSAGIFDQAKLLSLNAHYIREESLERLCELAMPFFKKMNLDVANDETLKNRVSTVQERAHTLEELVEAGAFYYLDEVEMDEKAAKKFLKPGIKDYLVEIADMLDELQEFSIKAQEDAFIKFLDEKEIKLGKVAQPLRVSLTGKKAGPGLFETMEALGKEKTVNRIRRAAESIG